MHLLSYCMPFYLDVSLTLPDVLGISLEQYPIFALHSAFIRWGCVQRSCYFIVFIHLVEFIITSFR